jgi:hypothetical protein
MRSNNFEDKFIVVSGIIFAVLFIGFFIWFPTIEFSGPGPTRAMSEEITFSLCYLILSILSVALLVNNLLWRKKITKKWIKYFAFLPIALVLGTPLFSFLSLALEPSIETQCHKLICELKSSELLQNGQREFDTTGSIASGPILKPRKEGNNYIYTISALIYKQKKRELRIEADNCNAVFLFDIPEMPKPQPFSRWEAPERLETSQPYVKLQLRYKVIKK